MTIVTQKWIRKPLYVDAVQITEDNFDEICVWCQGTIEFEPMIEGSKKYIKVRVHNPKTPRQTKAFVGDWLLYTERGYKVYIAKAFYASFDKIMESVAKPYTEITKLDDDVIPLAEQPISQLQARFADGKRVLSEQDQKELTNDEIKELVQSGEAVLVQDLV